MRIVIISALAFALSGCVLFSEETQTECDLAKEQIWSRINVGTPSNAEVALQIDACLDAIERDSKQWSIELELLKRAMEDALDDFLTGALTFGDAEDARKVRAAEIQIILDAKQ